MVDSHSNGHANGHSHDGHGHDEHGHKPDHIEVRVLRQDGPGQPSYWERHSVKYEADMNVISVLQRIAANAKNAEGKHVAPVAWDCNCLEEVCGACTMVINGKVRQACSALVDKLLSDNPAEIELQPMTKFPVVRDLAVDRTRLFSALSRVKAWVPVDGYYDMGAGPRYPAEDQETAYPLSQCMSCGCCVEACPQYTKVELERIEGETEEAYNARCKADYDRAFVGPHAISQAMLFNQHPTGKNIAGERLDALTAEGGLQVCGNAQNCVAVCPKLIPLTTSIARAGRATTLHVLKKWFGA
ncbi:succinate dehydrogenase and fumarate reductase iron-sulfur protein [Pirellula staleyi DSM 6068]|uniref:Succinate dehydrogenase and fumarate reductase iron-sulfur protein n=1 Tax=Pirellula staleyi (strain ATCC 27377 / DSM 6068 / ICPB 4128) TaxID=530564 RepID=D2R6H3_PIRSD|nr:succinate dehydrogenase iron-sulfur subunit [Pirellula staleyi]ADB15551.1 succinate dehydrogenase and fumarate reductase iron-sulfur protein [Pirellula staleyi DSM 6068]